jgi:hypothetical protein
MSTNIALHTTQIPPATSPHQEIIAIIDLTRERALELLELMNEITLRASASSTAFRISSFETAALYVPAFALATLPPAGDFVVLPPDYTVTSLTPIKLVHTNVMPLFTNLDAAVLKAIASGLTLPPGTTKHALKHAEPRSDHDIITCEENWLF